MCTQATCQICFEEFDLKNMRAARCKHYFCKPCWRGYISNAISSGPSVLSLRCPLPDCTAAVSPRMPHLTMVMNTATCLLHSLGCPLPDCTPAVSLRMPPLTAMKNTAFPYFIPLAAPASLQAAVSGHMPPLTVVKNTSTAYFTPLHA